MTRKTFFSLISSVSLLALALAGGCEETDPTNPPDPMLEIGTGEGRYSSFMDGDTLELVSGCQGSQHVWVGLRATSLDPRGTLIDLSLRGADDDATVSQAFLVRVSMDPVPGDPHLAEVYGLQLIIAEPDVAIGRDLILYASVRDRDGVEVSHQRPVRVDWGMGGCR